MVSKANSLICLLRKLLGRLLAVGFDSGILLLMNTHTGGIVQKLQITKTGESLIRYLAWGLSLTDTSITRHQIQAENSKITLESLLDQVFQDTSVELPPDLPAELAALDVETLLPKMSPIPAMNRE